MKLPGIIAVMSRFAKIGCLTFCMLPVLWSSRVHAQTLITKTPMPRQHYDRYVIRTRAHDTLTFYLSRGVSNEQLPLWVFVQGSGRFSLFNKDTVLNYGTRGLAGIAGHKARVLLVEKPGIAFMQGDASHHDPAENQNFNRQFSLKSWRRTLETAIQYVVKNERVNAGKVMIMGHSEGGLAAAAVAHDLKKTISHVTLLAGEGPSQFYSLYAFARSGELFDNAGHTKSETERIDSLQSKWNDILKNPLATDRIFFGYTYLRWSSFLNTSVLEELENYPGKVFIAQGTADKNVSPESAIFLYTGLLAKGKDVKLKLAKDADHSFYSRQEPDGWPKVLNEALTWFLN